MFDRMLQCDTGTPEAHHPLPTPSAERLHEPRQEWLSALSCADPAELSSRLHDALQRIGIDRGSFTVLRPPEIGTALISGRVGATGAPFGVGEMTLTRCVVERDGVLGVGYVRGRAPTHASDIAVADALLQGAHAAEVHQSVVDPIADAIRRRRAARAVEAASTRVEFLTMVRGD
jgi:alpha-D-ribose 1-methylphosphonate 5-triphosphate synthase subunit PhnG